MDVSGIITKVFDKVSAKLDNVIKTVTITRAGGTKVYDPVTGTYTGVVPATTSGRCVMEDETIGTALRSAFPGYVPTGTEKLVFMSELAWAPKEGDTATIDGVGDKKVAAVLDLLAVHAGYRVIVI